jgi:hypothetical protein
MHRSTPSCEDRRVAGQALLNFFQLTSTEHRLTPSTLVTIQTIDTEFFKPIRPSLNGALVLTEKLGDLLAALSVHHQQQGMQSMMVDGNFRT